MAALAGPGGAAVHVCGSTSGVAAQLADFVVRLAAAAVGRHGKFTVALSGGSLPAVLARDLRKRAAEAHLDKWDVWYADEWVRRGAELLRPGTLTWPDRTLRVRPSNLDE